MRAITPAGQWRAGSSLSEETSGKFGAPCGLADKVASNAFGHTIDRVFGGIPCREMFNFRTSETAFRAIRANILYKFIQGIRMSRN